MNPVMDPFNAPGNIASAVALALSANFAVFLDLGSVLEGQFDITDATGAAVAATCGVKVEPYMVKGHTTLSADVAGGATSMTVGSAAGIYRGSKLMVGDEVVTVSTSYTVGSTTVGLAAGFLRAHTAAGAPDIYLLSGVATQGAFTAGNNQNTVNTVFGGAVFLPTGRWVLLLTNLDATNAVTVEVTQQTVSKIQ